MIGLILSAVLATILWPAAVIWLRRLDAQDVMAAYRPTAAQVAATERAHLPKELL